ncbi:hypothetical protein PZ938_02050 [Luteipulveratus sp. YIM 133132]|uniref:hypothetical protein n=1 Tax=Luteipulveratus flavus TaxID=3031728 RepID=UPI0023AF9491|nr:hypothetical protein [Luteipulveratus sp. YIM 133132]MDE9364376.1 hypothetical protein [Luteipulveratus sp. YIM 133132]
MSLAIGGVAEVDDGQLIRDAVVDLREAAGAVLTHAGNIKRAWSGLATAYHAPEQQLVLRAMDQPESRAATLRDAVGKAAKALNTYSWECDRLSGVQTRLVADLVTFDLDRQRIQAANSGDGSHQTDLLNRENALEGRLNRFHADLDLAQIICRNAMNDLWGEDDYQRVGETHVFDKTVYGFTGDGYHQMTRAGRTPWGAPTMWRDIHPSVIRLRQSQGSLESGKQYADALLSLNGTYGPGRQAAAGSGFAQTGLDLLVFSAQMSGMRVDPAGESRGRLFGMLKSMVGVDTARTDPNGTVGALSVDLLLSLSTGGGGSAAKAFLETASLSLAGRAPAQATRISALASADRALSVRPGLHGDMITTHPFVSPNKRIATTEVRFEIESVGNSRFRTPGGLTYGRGSKHKHRLSHVLQHAFPDPNKKNHTVFLDGGKVLQTIDAAWGMRGVSVEYLNGKPRAYIVPMGRVIGTEGETSVKIVVRPGTNEVITAYPVP